MNARFPDSMVSSIGYREQAMTECAGVFIQIARDDLDRFASATAQMNVNLEALQAVAVPIPPPEEQRRISEVLDRAFSVLREVDYYEVDANLLNAQSQRSAGLSRVFRTV